MTLALKSLFSYLILPSCFLFQVLDLSEEITLFSKNFLIIYLSDKTLCFLFGDISRWYQLHSLVNIYITYETYNDYLLYLIDPINGIIYKDTYYIGHVIFCLHFYHIIMFNNLDL